MGVTMSILPQRDHGAYLRYFLLVSVVLNVGFMGAAGAVAFRYTGAAPVNSGPGPLTYVMHFSHNMRARLNDLAATLPTADANLLRAEMSVDARQVASAQADLRLSREALRETFRAEPFNAEKMRAAMATDRLAHENFEMVLHNVIASAVARMSVMGRNKLADFAQGRETASNTD
jgi:uncharacterized membrane protein